jgi:hypothetical protein
MLHCHVALLVSVLLPLVPMGLHLMHLPLIGLKHFLRLLSRNS